MRSLLYILSSISMVGAHNWLSSPARADNGFNGYQNAPCPPKGAKVHVQVQAGQKFAIEWATGHGTPERGPTYLVVVKADDEALMKRHSRQVLEKYIDNAPADNKHMDGHHTFHVGSGGDRSIQGDATAYWQSIWEGKTTAPRHYGNAPNKPPRSSKIYRKTTQATMRDKRVAYKSNEFPWIVSAHKFWLHEDKSEEADIALMEIPADQPSGKYIVQYIWNGYYDCVDVNVIDEPSTDLWGGPSSEVAFDRVHHCLFNRKLAGYQIMTDCMEIKKGGDTRQCESACKNKKSNDPNRPGCVGIQVSPYTLPADAIFAGTFPNTDAGRHHLPGKCSGKNFAEDSFVCYGVHGGEPIIGSTYDLVADPEDPKFYSTCYTMKPAWKFDQECKGCVPAVPEPAFVFGDKCISCGLMERNERADIVPEWKFTDKCIHCDKSIG